METTNVTAYADGGITLFGKIKEIPAGLKQYGFALSVDSTFKTQTRYLIISSAVQTGDIKYDINNGLIKGIKYFFSIYYTDETQVPQIFNVKSFIANAGKSIKITTVSPLKADLGDTLTITGKYFTGQPFNIKFDNVFANRILSNDTVVKFTVPSNVSRVNPLIIVATANQTDTISRQFSLNTPEIKSFTPVATFNDTVVINGDHFGNFQNGNEVYFDNVKAMVTKYSRKQLKVIVPENIDKSSSTISVKAQLQTTLGSTKFKITEPQFTLSPTSGYIGQTMTIEGKDFHPLYYLNKVFLGDNAVKLISGSTTKLTFAIPNGIYPHGSVKMAVMVLDYTKVYGADFKVKDRWVAVDYKMPFDTYSASGAFTINNVSYVISGEKGASYPKYLWKFDPTDYSWQKLNNLPVEFSIGLVSATNTNAYLYIQGDKNGNPVNDNFWEYNPTNDTWRKKQNFPNKTRYKMFAIGNKIYLGMALNSAGAADNSFFSYSVDNNSWAAIATYPDPATFYIASFPPSFVIGGVAYLGGGSSSNFYSYTQSTNTWKQVSSPPEYGSSQFSYNGKGFMLGTGTMYNRYVRYDPSTDTWFTSPDVIMTPTSMTRGVTFINNGNVYICTGNAMYYTLTTPVAGL